MHRSFDLAVCQILGNVSVGRGLWWTPFFGHEKGICCKSTDADLVA
jgi:hypothetical protein